MPPQPVPPLPHPPLPALPVPQPSHPTASASSTVLVAGTDPVLDHLLDVRVVHVGGVLDDDATQRVCARLRLLAARDARHDVVLTVSCTGGPAGAALAVVDTMELIGPDVATCVVGAAAGVGLLLAASGAPGKRTATAHARLTLLAPAEPFGMAVLAPGQQADVVALLAARTGQGVDRITADTAARRWFTTPEAVAYGLVDGPA